MKVCRDCGVTKPLGEFHKHNATKDRKQLYCKSCQNMRHMDWRSRNTAKLAEYERNRPKRSAEDRRRRQLWAEYRIRPEQYDALVAAQGGRCAICLTIPEPAPGKTIALYVDHDHQTQAVRGLLCHKCNLGVGHFNDSVETLVSAIAYLETHAAQREAS